MNEEKYNFKRSEVAEAAGCSSDVVRMEQKKGTFGSCWGMVRWVMAKRLLSGGSIEKPVVKAAHEEGLGYEPDHDHDKGNW